MTRQNRKRKIKGQINAKINIENILLRNAINEIRVTDSKNIKVDGKVDGDFTFITDGNVNINITEKSVITGNIIIKAVKPIIDNHCICYNKPVSCYIGQPISNHSYVSGKDYDIYNNVCRVYVDENKILNCILDRLGCVCGFSSQTPRSFLIFPDYSKYEIVVKEVTCNSVILEQWNLHYEDSTLINWQVRKVIINFK